MEADRLLTIVEIEEDHDEGDFEMDETAGGKPTMSAKKEKATTKPSALDEAVFAQSYIPRALDQVYDPERDVQRVLRGEGKDLIYADITGVASIHRGNEEELAPGMVRFADGHVMMMPIEGGEVLDKVVEEKESEEDSEEEGESGSESGSGEEDERRPRGHKHEDRDEKKVSRSPFFSSL